jgi:DNA-binding LacI/PurR family transcriptional regulator
VVARVPAGGAPRRAQLKDVAAVAGVSFQTVSRALNKGPKVSPETRKRVLAAAQELGYRRNGTAHALKTGRSSLVAVLTSDTTRYGFAETLRGVEQAARDAGFGVTISILGGLPDGSAPAAVAAALQHGVDGAVVLKFDPGGVAALRFLPAELPVSVAGGARARLRPQVVLAEGAGATAATRHLLDLGHRTVHHLAAPAFGLAGDRVDGWRNALVDRGIAPPEIVEGFWDPGSGEVAAQRLLREGATAVLCGNDDLAIGLIRGLQDLGVRIPEDVSVVGFDDIRYARLWRPGLTTVRQDFYSLGATAFGLLRTILDGRARPRSLSIPTELVVRSSTAPPPGHRLAGND